MNTTMTSSALSANAHVSLMNTTCYSHDEIDETEGYLYSHEVIAATESSASTAKSPGSTPSKSTRSKFGRRLSADAFFKILKSSSAAYDNNEIGEPEGNLNGHSNNPEAGQVRELSAPSANSPCLTPTRSTRPKFGRRLSADAFFKTLTSPLAAIAKKEAMASEQLKINKEMSGASTVTENSDTERIEPNRIEGQILDKGSQDTRTRVRFCKTIVSHQYANPIKLTDDEKKLLFYGSNEIKEIQNNLCQEYKEYQQKLSNDQNVFQRPDVDHLVSSKTITDNNSFCLRGIEKLEIINPRSREVSLLRYQSLVQAILQEQQKARTQSGQPPNVGPNGNDKVTTEERLRRLSMSMTRSDIFFAKEIALQDYKDSYPDALR